MPLYAIAAAVLVQLVWGGNYSASKLALMEFPPLLMITLRFILLSLILAPFVLCEKLPSRRRMKSFAIIGLTTLVFHFATLLFAMHMGLNVTSCALAVQLGVPFSCILATFLFKDYLGPWRSAGLAIAFVGVIVVTGTPNAYEHLDAFLLVIVSTFGWSLGNLYLKIMKPEHAVPLLFWPGLMAMISIGLMSLVFDTNHLQYIEQASWRAWLGIAYSAVFSSIVGYGLWNWLMTRYPVNDVVPYSLLLPIFAIAGGVAFFGDPFNWHILLGASLTIAGVGIIALRRPRLAAAEKM